MGETNTIKAIETVYNGYRFRSRLEARWAVFFDTLGIKYDYELEGFDLGDAGWYLPDFWLPQVKMWAEVKAIELNENEVAKAKALAKQSGHSVLMLVGTPDNKPYWAWEWADWEADLGGTSVFTTVDYCLTMYHNYPIDEGRFYCMPGDHGPHGDAYWDDTAEAASAARQARFEHGEHGYERKSYEPSLAIGVTAR